MIKERTEASYIVVRKLVTKELEETLLAVGDRWSMDKRSIGEITLTLIAQIKEGGLEASVMDVYSVVSDLLRGEIKPRTVRYYADTVKFYPTETWEKYDVLPFSHFDFAKKFGKEWATVLELSLKRMDSNGGYPPTVRWLEAATSGWLYEIQGQWYTEPEGELIEEAQGLADDSPELEGWGKVDEEDNGNFAAPEKPVSRKAAREVVNFLSRSIAYFAQALTKLPIKPALKTEADGLISDLADVVEEIEKNIA